MSTYSSFDDNELLVLLKNDNANAFAELYDRYWEKMVIIAFLKLESKFDAEEVVQELFVNIWERRKKIRITDSFHAYISGALKYKIYSFFTKRKTRNNNNEQIQVPAFSNNTEELFIYETLREDLEKAVLHLPPKCRLVFKLSRENGYSNKEIAENLHISQKAVEKHLTKALSYLNTALKFFFLYFF